MMTTDYDATPAPVLADALDAQATERHSRGATRCGLCGELTDQELCCGEAVW